MKKCGRVYGVSLGKCIEEVGGEVWGVWGKVRGDVGV